MDDALKLVWESIAYMENGLEAKLSMLKKFFKNSSKLEYIVQGLKGIEEHSAKGMSKQKQIISHI
jgi:hypothetical protein